MTRGARPAKPLQAEMQVTPPCGGPPARLGLRGREPASARRSLHPRAPALARPPAPGPRVTPTHQTLLPPSRTATPRPPGPGPARRLPSPRPLAPSRMTGHPWAGQLPAAAPPRAARLTPASVVRPLGPPCPEPLLVRLRRRTARTPDALILGALGPEQLGRVLDGLNSGVVNTGVPVPDLLDLDVLSLRLLVPDLGRLDPGGPELGGRGRAGLGLRLGRRPRGGLRGVAVRRSRSHPWCW